MDAVLGTCSVRYESVGDLISGLKTLTLEFLDDTVDVRVREFFPFLNLIVWLCCHEWPSTIPFARDSKVTLEQEPYQCLSECTGPLRFGMWM